MALFRSRLVPWFAPTLALVFVGVATARAVPSAPTGLLAIVAGSSVTLTWLPPSVGPVIGYRVEVGSASGLTDVANLFVGPVTSLSAAAVPNGTYFIRVRAVASDGDSEPSSEVVARVGAGGGCSSPPGPPLNLAASVTGSVISLSWIAGGGCPPSSFILHAGSAPGLSNIATVNVGAALGLTASAPQGTFYVRVYAQNAFGTSGASAEVVVRVGGTGGIVVLSNDDWVLSDTAFSRLPTDTANLAVNLARFLAGRSGRIHAYSDYFSLTGTQLAATLRNAGFNFTAGIGINFNVPTLSTFDAVFVGVPFLTPAQITVLEQYVVQGGNVYIHAGNVATDPSFVPNVWNSLLARFDLRFESRFNAFRGIVAISSSHPLFAGVSRVYIEAGHPVAGCCVVATSTTGEPLFAAAQNGRIP